MKTKKMISRIISVLLAVVMVATCAPVMGFAANESNVSKVTYIANTIGGVKIKFSEVDNASEYKIFRQVEDGDFEQIATSTSDTFIDKTVENGVMYTYYAKAVKDVAEKALFAANNDTEDEDISKSILYVEAPLFTVENSDIGPVITVNPVEGATSYQIKRRGEDDTAYKLIGEVTDGSDMTFTDVDVENGKTYKYSVVAVMYEGYSYYNSASLVAEIAEVMTDENATAITYIANQKNGVKLTFKEVEGATYTLYRKTENGTFKSIAVTDKTLYVDTTVESGVLYTYKVAVTGYYFGDSERTIMFLATPDFTVANAGTGVKVDFEAVEGATAYEIKRHDNTTSVFTRVGTVSADKPLTFFDKTAENDTQYTYSVVAVNGKYMSYYNTAKILTFLTSPVVLANVQTGVKISYTKCSEATKYTIYRRTDDTDWEVVNSFKPRTYFYSVDTTVESGVIYYYSIQVDAGDKSTGYDPEGVKIMYLESPTLFLSNDDSSVTIDFTATPGAVSYNVFRKLPNSGSYKIIGKVSASDALTFVDTDVEPGETYTYGVKAVNGSYTSYFKVESIEMAVIFVDGAVSDAIATVISAVDTDKSATAGTATTAAAATDATTTDIINTITDFANRTTGILKIFQAIINILLFIPNTLKAFSTISNIFKLFI